MKSHARISCTGLLTLLASALIVIAAPTAQAGFGVSLWEAGTCINHTCTYKSVKEEPKEAFTQAAGHPPWGITTFELNHTKGLLGEKPDGAPLKRVRVDVAPGLASNPQAPLDAEGKKCSIKQFEVKTGPECPAGTEVGTDEATVVVGGIDVPAKGKVYNLEPEPGEPEPGLRFEPIPLLFGIAITYETPLHELALERSFLEGHLSWAKEKSLQERCVREPAACPVGGISSGDYHEWFEIDNLSEKTPVLKSQLNFNGRAGGNFITLPSECSASTTNYIELESWTKEISTAVTHTPVGVGGCNAVPFAPTTEVKPETSQSDEPDGATTEVKVAQKAGPEEINTADIKDAHVTLPEGLTLNAAAARGLKACSPAQIAIGETKPVECPAASKVGEVTIEADLPEKSIAGNVYLGAPTGEPIIGPPFTIYVDAESPRFGFSVRLKGQVEPNPTTGRLEVTFLENPQQPFSDFIMKSKGGPQAPLANPLACEAGHVESVFTPYTGLASALSSSPFAASGCPSPVPFSLQQSTLNANPNAGAYSSYTFNLARADGQQYLSRVQTVLPAGLVGVIPSVTLCDEAQAQSGSCGAASQIGSAKVLVGAGSEPYEFSGPVFLTGPYNGAPFGLSIPVAAVAGPFSLGTVVTRATINVDPHTSRVIATSSLPTIVAGVPLRLRSVSVAVNRPNFLFNPTNCGALATNTTLTSTFNATQSLSSPFGVANCNALPFKPIFAVSSSAQTSKANGASLKVSLTQGAHQANIHSVVVALPLQLPSRLTTLQKACSEATYAANPFGCPVGSKVGSATVTTPVLPGQLTGPAYLVSHGGAAFPDLDLLLEGDGVRVILEGNTNIKGGVTTSTFASIPDVPVSSFVLDLPSGPYSVLAANGSLCTHALIMPTTITAQSGAQVKQNTEVSVAGCPFGSYRHKVRILRRKIVRHTLVLKIQTLVAGRVSAGGKDLRTARKRIRKPSTFTLRVPLSRGGLKALHASARRHHRLKITVRVTLVPVSKGEGTSTASTRVAFKR